MTDMTGSTQGRLTQPGLKRQTPHNRGMANNALYFGDNLDVLRESIRDESVDLIYLDPPFNSARDYNILCSSPKGIESSAQITAFEDSWHWGEQAEREFGEIVRGSNTDVAEMIQALRKFLGENDMMAYLTMMANRLLELHRVLKPTGSLYLHCDPTASHYLKIVLDGVFGKELFRNDIIWKRRYGTFSTVHTSNKFGACTDNILLYAKSDAAVFYPQYSFDDPTYQSYIEKTFRYFNEDGRRYRIDNLANPALRPNLIYEYKGYKPPKNGWAISLAKMEQWDAEGRLHFPKSPDGRIQRRRFLDALGADSAIYKKAISTFSPRLTHSLNQIIVGVQGNAEHPLRKKFDAWVKDFVLRLKADPDWKDGIARYQQESLASPEVKALLDNIWGVAKLRLSTDLSSDAPLIGVQLGALLRRVGETLAADADLREWLNQAIKSGSAALIRKYRGEVAKFIEGQLALWTKDEMSQRIELAIGRDLQFIRINGTLVGGLVGVIIYALTQLAGHT